MDTPTLNILLVDDDPDMGCLTEMLLKDAGHRVTHCLQANAALEAVAAQDFECMLTDINLPGCSGIELIRDVRKQRPTLRIVALTGSTRESDRERAVAAGADDYLCKPVSVDTLLNALQGTGSEE